jgi:hypothetical protein
MGDAPPPAECYRGRMLKWSFLEHVAKDVLLIHEWSENGWMNLLLIIYVILQNTPTRTPKTRGTN